MGQSFQNIQVGDKVVCMWRNNESIETVTSVTPTGKIKIGYTSFNKNGRQIGTDSWSTSYIKKATDEDIRRIKEKQTVQYALRKMQNCNSLTYKQAVSILEILEVKEEPHEQT